MRRFRFKLTSWMTVLLLAAAFLSTALAWLIASQLPLGTKNVPRYYYPTEQDITQRVERDIKRYESGQTPNGDYEWAVYRSNGTRVDASPDFPRTMTPSRLLAAQTPGERDPSDESDVRTLHHMQAINLGESSPGYFLSIETVTPRLNQYQVGNSTAFFFLQLGLFILFLFGMTRWIAGLFRQLETRLERLVEPDHAVSPLRPVKGPREFKTFAHSIERVGDELDVLRRNEQERFTEQLRLITSLSHDLRTPLTSIQGFVQWLSEHHTTLSDQERTDVLAIVSRQSETLASRIDELFMLAKLSNKDYPVHMTSLDFVTLLHQVAEQHPETTYQYTGPAHLTVQADPNLLRRLIENLVRNATLHGTGDLSFEVLQESGHLTFRCSNAIAETLTPHQLTELATPFVTSDMSRSNGGSGIGLSIIEQIVARHNGTMQLTSDQNRFIVSVVLPDAYKEG